MAKWKNKSDAGSGRMPARGDKVNSNDFELPPVEDFPEDDAFQDEFSASTNGDDAASEADDKENGDSDDILLQELDVPDADGADALETDVDFDESADDNTDAPTITEEFLRQLPKVELHCHLDGSLRIETILELAEQQKVRLPASDPDALRKLLVVGEDCRSLEQYLKAFEITLSVMQDEKSLERIAYELVADAADENIRYLEVRYSPILHTRKGLRLSRIVDAVNDGLSRGEREFGVVTGVIICGMRNINPEVSYQLAELAVAYKNRGVVAFDLAGAETDHPAKNHREAFFLILRNNINCTLHAGESYGPESIHQALHYCGAHRIGHGTRLKEDGDLLNYVNDHRIPLEICLTSNVQTRATKSFGEHPLRFYYDYGLRTTLNTDNRLMSDTTVSKELLRAHTHLGFEMDELIDLIIFGFKSSFLPYRAKVKMLSKVYDEFRAMGLTARTQRICDPEDGTEKL